MHQEGKGRSMKSNQQSQSVLPRMQMSVAQVVTVLLCCLLLVNFLKAQTIGVRLLDGALLLSVLVYGLVFITSVAGEMRARQKVQSLQQKIDLANDRLVQLEQQKSEFISIASHQLRTPLTAIKGYASMALEGSFGTLSDDVTKQIDTIFTASKKLVVLVEDLLTVSRIEQGKTQYDWEKVDVKEVVQSAVKENESDIVARRLNVSIRSEREGMEYLVWADHERLKQVFNNIIDNAVKFTPKGFVRVLISKDESRSWIRVSISDTGVGMDAKTREMLFVDPQKKVQMADKENKAAVVGIGVYIAQQIIKTHKGRLWADSDGQGRGSTFFVELPTYKEGESEKQMM
jgi:signal transduction histidine kinase